MRQDWLRSAATSDTAVDYTNSVSRLQAETAIRLF